MFLSATGFDITIENIQASVTHLDIVAIQLPLRSSTNSCDSQACDTMMLATCWNFNRLLVYGLVSLTIG